MKCTSAQSQLHIEILGVHREKRNRWFKADKVYSDLETLIEEECTNIFYA